MACWGFIIVVALPRRSYLLKNPPIFEAGIGIFSLDVFRYITAKK
jgi:hypothetical protein